ncbi:apoptosis-enhancing nuclease [Esox lucius]|uniref:Exonuclease domain-containing protein n=1 Tax=Esox lucius TaxID=8010 RepID=A0A3P8XAL5_ESOLU|nr:apoptosis-enhancing nuclease [Esox lucius]XP_010899666.2 apoptosis-enhancing nuclease [Esox lucius]XP_010899667.2 apoptosis-enhancing nuclease [Esox lucius]XP_010899668.2 apoptosis-enhancing nuclease [Esox lucius]
MERTMSEAGTSTERKNYRCHWGLLSNYRYLSRKAMLLRTVENARTRKKKQNTNQIPNKKRKRTEDEKEALDTAQRLKKIQLCEWPTGTEVDSALKSTVPKTHGVTFGLPLPAIVEDFIKTASGNNRVDNQNISVDRKQVATALREQWELDSGFSSETSPPASGRCTPCHNMCPTTMVAMDCEMVGTGPGGRTSEVARCSLVDYHGNVLYDKYILPRHPVTDYRTRWSGIQKHHFQNAQPFPEARTEILQILEGKVVIGHALYNDFQALDFMHPGHMVRDTSGTSLLRRLAGFSIKRCVSLKILANSLLNRQIQVGRKGHSSVEDALASLDLYKLVEEDWEQEMRERMRDRESGAVSDPATSNHYMQDKYWPEVLTEDAL